ncbi:MAG TPA: RidA family protein [Actinomycetota bacterium]|nr:RidA family protein [Actinomycetota bacterium]
MTHIERRNVPGLAEPPGYTHLATVRDCRLVFVAGQVPLDREGTLVGRGDAREQARQCLRNLEACLAEAGASPDDVVRTTVYVVPTERSSLADVWGELRKADLGAVVRTPATLVGVAQLGYEGQLVEIESTAAIPMRDR